MNKELEYSSSLGTNLFDRGPRNMVPKHNYPSGTGKSHVFYGPAYYVPSENRWITQDKYRSLPRETRRDAILFESEDDWVAWKIKNDKPHPPSGRQFLCYGKVQVGNDQEKAQSERNSHSKNRSEKKLN